MGMFFIQLGVRILVFGLVFWLVARKHERVTVSPRWAIAPVAGLFGVLNAGLYWVLSFLVSLASLFTLSIVAPVIANAVLLWGTTRLLKGKWLKIDGIVPMAVLVGCLTLAHGALWFVFEHIVA